MAFKTYKHWSNNEFSCIGPYSVSLVTSNIKELQ